MIQEVNPRFVKKSNERTLPLFERDSARSLKVDEPEILPPVHLYKKKGPKFPEGFSTMHPTGNAKEYEKCMQEYKVWSVTRMLGSGAQNKNVPAFGGFVTATGKAAHSSIKTGLFRSPKKIVPKTTEQNRMMKCCCKALEYAAAKYNKTEPPRTA